MRDATNALLDALPLSKEDQKRRLAKAARIIRDTQRKNAAAKKSHAKARRKRLLKLGIRTEDGAMLHPGAERVAL